MAKHKISKSTSGKRRTPTRSSKKAATSRRTKSSLVQSTGSKRPTLAGDEQVTVDRRRGDRREHGGEPAADKSVAPEKLERRQKVNRRRQIDPTTCERDYTEQEVEFMNALDEYKRKSGRMFPTCSEMLEVIRSLGYVKLAPAESGARVESDLPVTSAKPMPVDWSQPRLESGSAPSEMSAPAEQLT